MPLVLRTHTSSARLTIFLDKFTESRPGILTTDEVNGFILTRMSGKDMIMLVAENTEPEIVGVRNIDEIVVTEKSVRSKGPTRLRFFKLGLVEWVGNQSRKNIRGKLFLIHDNCCAEN